MGKQQNTRTVGIDGLTEKQRQFVHEYTINGGNGTQAAIVCGYGDPAASASRALRNAKVCQAIANANAPLEKHKIATREERQAFWASVMRGDHEDARMADRLKAAELLGKSQADFIDRVDIQGDGPVAFVMDIRRKSRGKD